MSHIRRKQKLDYIEGKESEFFFRKWTGAENAPKELERKHIDCILDGKTVDVKGLKKSHKDGYVLVEFKAVDGRPGWGSTGASADLIAFQFPEGFYVVDRLELSKMAQMKVFSNPTGAKSSTVRGNSIPPVAGLYSLVGRPSRKDVFTYITKEDLLSLNHHLYEPKDE
jgi:hypothetical protein